MTAGTLRGWPMRLMLLAAVASAGVVTWTFAVVLAQQTAWHPVVLAVSVTAPLVAAVPLVATARHRGLAWAYFAVAFTNAALAVSAAYAPTSWLSGAVGMGLVVVLALSVAVLTLEN